MRTTEFALPKGGAARLDIYDLGGHLVHTLVDGPVGAGMTTIPWDGLGENGRGLPPGT